MASIFPICMGKGNARNGLPNMGANNKCLHGSIMVAIPTFVVSDNTVKHF